MSIPSFSNSFQPWTLIGIWRDTPAPVVQTSRHQRLKGESSLPRAWPSRRGISLGPAQRGDLLVLSSLTLRGPASSWELSSKFRQGLRPQPRAGLTQSPGPLPGSDALRWPLCHSGLNAVPSALFPALEVSIVMQPLTCVCLEAPSLRLDRTFICTFISSAIRTQPESWALGIMCSAFAVV